MLNFPAFGPGHDISAFAFSRSFDGGVFEKDIYAALMINRTQRLDRLKSGTTRTPLYLLAMRRAATSKYRSWHGYSLGPLVASVA